MKSACMAVSIAGSPSGLFQYEPEPLQPKHNMWQRLGRSLWFGRDESTTRTEDSSQSGGDTKANLRRTLSKKVGVGLPRAPTFKRQNSERRDRLEPVEPCLIERRTMSLGRQRALSIQRTPTRTRSPPPFSIPRLSAPAVSHNNDLSVTGSSMVNGSPPPESIDLDENAPDRPPLKRVDSANFSEGSFPRDVDEDDLLELELDRKWILNLSMHFRDKSDREKFFVTYAETPTKWRRVTVSCDYRAAPPDSLERDLKELQYQRDKSARIYESIRESLQEIQFYDTVTNLKLETSDGRLHVHVTEDVNEIIPYPPLSSVGHLGGARHVRECQVEFDSHLSGFVYKVKVAGKEYIKKEIPGPDTVDEFLYEINALHALCGSTSVIQFEAVIVDDKCEVVKGLLIGFAEQGALVDLLYDFKGELQWKRREKWAKEIVCGLAEIHEAGYVQGDFTLSNVVIDGKDHAQIIDINRRGCPVGWEPPEISKKIESNQRISMYIGVKSDLFQLGMTLWALATQEDEPERQERPLNFDNYQAVPGYYRELVQICLSDRPQDRLSAKELLLRFPPTVQDRLERPPFESKNSFSGRTEKEYIEPSTAVDRADIEAFRAQQEADNVEGHKDGRSTGQMTYTNPPSSDLQFDSGSSYVGVTRGRRPATNRSHVDSPRGRRSSRDEDTDRSFDDSDFEPQIVAVSPGLERRFEELELDGNRYLVPTASFEPEDMQILEQQGSFQTHHEPEMEQLEHSSIETISPKSSDLVEHPQGMDAPLGQVDDTDLDPPDMPKFGDSSNSTPRNSTTINPAASPRIFDSLAEHLVGVGFAPTLVPTDPPDEPPDSNSEPLSHPDPGANPSNIDVQSPFERLEPEPNVGDAHVQPLSVNTDFERLSDKIRDLPAPTPNQESPPTVCEVDLLELPRIEQFTDLNHDDQRSHGNPAP